MPSTTDSFALMILAAAACHLPANAQRGESVVDSDRWGIHAVDLTWNSPDRLASWMPDEDWSSFGGYYTEDLLSGYGGALGRYEWGEAEWRFSGWSAEGPRARHIDWRSDRFGVYEHGLRWATDSIGFDRWSERATYDWAGSGAPGSDGWFPF